MEKKQQHNWKSFNQIMICRIVNARFCVNGVAFVFSSSRSRKSWYKVNRLLYLLNLLLFFILPHFIAHEFVCVCVAYSSLIQSWHTFWLNVNDCLAANVVGAQVLVRSGHYAYTNLLDWFQRTSNHNRDLQVHTHTYI